MSGWGVFVIVVVVFLIFAAIGWVIFAHLRARRLGLPPPRLNPFSSRSGASRNYPSPAFSGPFAWLTSKFRALRSGRTAGGGYEEATSGRDRRGFGPLDPDEAWDTRVGNEADVYGPGGYYEEQELGLHGAGPYGGSGYGGQTPGAAAVEDPLAIRGRSRGRELDERYDEEMGRDGHGNNPFEDPTDRDASLRGVSPRPIDTGVGGRVQGHQANRSLGAASQDDSPTERRSMFRENM
ncbi:hypothetical protein BJ546DRAFT_1126988 [Cryomyces antarcticus]